MNPNKPSQPPSTKYVPPHLRPTVGIPSIPISRRSELIPSYHEHQKPSQLARLPTIPLYVPPHKRIQPTSTSISETHSIKKVESLKEEVDRDTKCVIVGWWITDRCLIATGISHSRKCPCID